MDTSALTVLSGSTITKVPSSSWGALINTVTEEEIKAALKSINGDKAPGPDGFNFAFYIKNWDIVGVDLVQAVHYIFGSGMMLPCWNPTAISLVPKVSAPVPVRHYRSIAFCNVPYKCH